MYAVQRVFIQCIVCSRSVRIVHSTVLRVTVPRVHACDKYAMERFSFRRMTRSSCTLQKQSFLALDVALNPAHEGLHGRVVTTP